MDSLDSLELIYYEDMDDYAHPFESKLNEISGDSFFEKNDSLSNIIHS